jgi:hypothetical protein
MAPSTLDRALIPFFSCVERHVPIQRICAIGIIHLVDDDVSYDVATADCMEQMRGSLTVNKVRFLVMTPAHPGDAGIYRTKIKFSFAAEQRTMPFLINPQRLTRRFWTRLGNSKTARSLEFE